MKLSDNEVYIYKNVDYKNLFYDDELMVSFMSQVKSHHKNSDEKDDVDKCINALTNLVETESDLKERLNYTSLPKDLCTIVLRYNNKLLGKFNGIVNSTKDSIIEFGEKEFKSCNFSSDDLKLLQIRLKNLKFYAKDAVCKYQFSLEYISQIIEALKDNIKNEIEILVLKNSTNFVNITKKTRVLIEIFDTLKYLFPFFKRELKSPKISSASKNNKTKDNDKDDEIIRHCAELLRLGFNSANQLYSLVCLTKEFKETQEKQGFTIESESRISVFYMLEAFVELEASYKKEITDRIFLLCEADYKVEKVVLPKGKYRFPEDYERYATFESGKICNLSGNSKIDSKEIEGFREIDHFLPGTYKCFSTYDAETDEYVMTKFTGQDFNRFEHFLQSNRQQLWRKFTTWVIIKHYLKKQSTIEIGLSDLFPPNRLGLFEAYIATALAEFNQSVNSLIERNASLDKSSTVPLQQIPKQSMTDSTSSTKSKVNKKNRNKKKKTRKKVQKNLTVPNIEVTALQAVSAETNNKTIICENRNKEEENHSNINDEKNSSQSTLQYGSVTILSRPASSSALSCDAEKDKGKDKCKDDADDEGWTQQRHRKPKNLSMTLYRPQNNDNSDINSSNNTHERGKTYKSTFKSRLRIFNSPSNLFSNLLQKANLPKHFDYFSALKEYKKVENKDAATYNAMGHCYAKIGKFKKSTKALTQIPNWDQMKDVKVDIAYNHLKLNEIDLASEIFKDVLKYNNTNTRALLGYARCLQDLGQYHNSIANLKLIRDYKKNKKALANIYFCYSKMGAHDEGFKYLQLIPNEQVDDEVLVHFGYCYLKMGNCDKAFNIFSKMLAKNKNNKDALMGMAQSYRKSGKLNKALRYYKKILKNNKANQHALFAIGNCYLDMKRPKEGIKYFKKIPNYEKMEVTLSFIGRFHERLGNHNIALEFFTSIEGQENKPSVLLNIALCYQKKGMHQEYERLVTEIMDRFPDFFNAYNFHAWYLVESEGNLALVFLENTLDKFPLRPSLYIILAKYFEINSSEEEMFNTLMEAKHKFPSYPEIYLNLLRYHLFKKNVNEVESIINECHERFPKLYPLFNRIKQLRKMPQFILPLCNTEDLNSRDNLKVDMPEHIEKIFAFLKPLCEECYLVGSTVLKLLSLSNEGETESDLDFVSTHKNSSAIFEKGFRASRHIPYLYTIIIYEQLIDFYSIPVENDWMDKNYRKRDFTISAIYCNFEGIIFDLTGMGVQDAKNKQLRMIGDPTVRLIEDPVRLLRAIRFILAGFKPVENLAMALHQWQSDIPDKAHLYAVARKHMMKLNAHEYVKSLQEYGLLKKLFGIDNNQNITRAIYELEQEIKDDSQNSFYYITRQNPRFATDNYGTNSDLNRLEGILNLN